jgi:GDP-D-mannose dehydratase
LIARLVRVEEDRMTRRIAVARIGAVFMVTLIGAASASAYGLVPAIAQTETKPVEPKPADEAKPEDRKEEEKPKTFWEENTLFACNGVLLTASRPEPSAAANLYYLVL